MKSSYVLLTMAVAVLSACGGGNGDGSGNGSGNGNDGSSGGTTPGGLYVGYYLEDAANNPENPTAGAYYLQLPDGDAGFSGEMSFSYFGCQSSNVGTVSGRKNGAVLTGNWTGTVDGTPVGGPYSGRYNPVDLSYSGTYSNTGGKVRVTVPNCIDYHVAALGTWEMFSVGAKTPSDFLIDVGGGNLSWADVAGVSRWLTSVYDVARASLGSNAVTRQALINAINGSAVEQSVPLSSLGLTSGRDYVLAITAFNSSYQRIGYTSLLYTAP